MKRSLIILAVLLLAAPIIQAKGVAGIGLGYDVPGVKDPGFSVFVGLQEEISPGHYIRATFNKFNYGNTAAIDNIAGTYLYMLGWSDKWDIGLRGFGNAEVQSPDWGYGFGVEADYLKIKMPEFIYNVTSGNFGDSFGMFAAVDMIHQPTTGYFMNLSIGITFLSQ